MCTFLHGVFLRFFPTLIDKKSLNCATLIKKNLYFHRLHVYLLCAMNNLVHTYEIKCGHGSNVYSLSCRFNYIKDNSRLADDYPHDLANLSVHMTHLTLSISNLSTLPVDTFDLFPNLQTLIVRTDLRNLTKEQFKNATKLAVLNLGFNNALSRIESNLFEHVPTLEFIDFAYNQIEEIEENAFAGLPKAEVLYLEANIIRRLANHTFGGAPNLLALDLSKNLIENVEEEALHGLGRLKRLMLNQNRIERLQQSIFHGMRSLERLDLSLNAIGEIEDGAFDGLDNLLFLELAFNRLTTLQDTLFDGAPNLISLFISVNVIEDVEFAFNNLTQLENLDLTFNPISYIDPAVFSNVTRLEHLELRGCNLTEINAELFMEQSNLLLLDLSLNNLTQIDLNVFDALDKLEFLKLSATGITELGNYTEIKHIMPALRFINLAENIIECPLVRQMVEYFERNSIEYEFGEQIDVGCELLPFASRALQAYELSKAEFIEENQIDD